MLAARDARVERQRELAREFVIDAAESAGSATTPAALASLTLVVPGPDKNPAWAVEVFDAAVRCTIDAVGAENARHVETHETIAGPQGYLVLAGPPHAVKRRLVEVEDTHPWGRLFDLDVVIDGVPVSRAEIGAPPRRCLVCDGPAAPCARSRAHDLPTLASAIAEVLA
ncbi:citrate lyase holo-[acyl-carrier protein] synthase [Mobilicoccus pelagius]|uniref:citrate lyase holo-[acyl-carrier protein] synthase n=1 Tax=Mobilicoccus pelagius TaxID=746032 RepID=UPI00145EC1C6|nr:citrate lyase holo-[acyl-carrier protein] synthase [Mobilicoccus pelagius]